MEVEVVDMAGEWNTAGKVRMTPAGTWNSSTQYPILSTVVSPDKMTYYIAKKEVPAGTLLSNTEYWDIVTDVSFLGTYQNDFKNVVKNQISFIETAQDLQSQYYKSITPLSTSKTYLIRLTVAEAGLYALRFGTNTSLEYMVDTLGPVTVQANVPYDFVGYTPSQSNFTKIRLPDASNCNIDIYEIININELDSNIVHYNKSDSKSDVEKAQARSNIGAVGNADLEKVKRSIDAQFSMITAVGVSPYSGYWTKGNDNKMTLVSSSANTYYTLQNPINISTYAGCVLTVYSSIYDSCGVYVWDKDDNCLDYVNADNAVAKGYTISEVPQMVMISAPAGAKYISNAIRTTYYEGVYNFDVQADYSAKIVNLEQETAELQENSTIEESFSALSVGDNPSAYNWVVGKYAYTNGSSGDSRMSVNINSKAYSLYGIRTDGYLIDKPDILRSINNVYIALYAFDNTDTYIGCWNGSEFIKTKGNAYSLINMADIRNTFSNYKFKLSAFNTTTTATITVEDTINNIYYCNRLSDISIEDTYNILPIKDKFTFTTSKNLTNLTIPAGTYTLSMKITSNDIDSDKCQVNFHTHSQTAAVTFHMFNRGIYEYWNVTLSQDCDEIRIFAGQGAAGSSGDAATVEDIMLVSGTTNKLYTPSVSPVDYIARNTLEGMKHNDVKIAFFGDSIVWGAIKTPNSGNTSFIISQANPTIAGVIGNRLHCTVDNYGVSGMGYKVAPSGGMNIYDYMQTIDLSSYTHVMILAGDNDSSVGETGIGTYLDTTGDTVMGQIYLIMTYLHTTYPSVIPVICHKNNKIALKTSPTATPTAFGSFPDYYYGYTYGGTDGFSIAKLHEEIDKFCEYYHVCKIDYKDFCMGGWQLQEMVGPDFTHFNQHGYNVLGKYLAEQVQKFIG